MACSRTMRYLWVVVLWLGVLPASAWAQSTIAGVVRDDSGGVIPGVNVEVSSPALIEKTRAAVTDAQGQYRIVDLRPGVYAMTFTLQGFNTLKRERVELQSDFTATVNAEMKVGALEESVTVTSAIPVVDVQSGVQNTVLTRAVLDAVPTGKNLYGLAALVPGSTTSKPDVGGSERMQTSGIFMHGLADYSASMDGVYLVSAVVSTQYINDQAIQEMSYRTTALPAEVSAGGTQVVIVGKEGSNAVHGSFYGDYQGRKMQWNNFDDDLAARGMRKVNSIAKMFDFNPAVGGPILRDRLWAFTSYRRWTTDRYVADTFDPQGNQALDDNMVWDAQARLSAQLSQNNRLVAYYDRNDKERYHRRDLTSEYSFIDDAGTYWQQSPLNYQANMRWTSTLSDKFLLDAGVTLYSLRWRRAYQDTVAPTDYATIDLARSTLTNAYIQRTVSTQPDRMYQASASYVTGAHSFKTGIWFHESKGAKVQTAMNGDVRLYLQNGVPTSVRLFNTPNVTLGHVNSDVAVFAQDTWTIKRATINGGLRFERVGYKIPSQVQPGGTYYAAVTVPEIGGLPTFTNVVPRLSVAYDLFGTGRTALKFSASQYMAVADRAIAQNINPYGLFSNLCGWNDANGDLKFTQNEIGACNGFSGGTDLRYDPELTRPFNWEYMASIQQEVLPQFSVQVAYYRRHLRNNFVLRNNAVPTSSYLPVDVTNPLDGTSFTIYNQDPATRGMFDRIATNDAIANGSYQGVEFRADKRFKPGAFLSAGVTIGRNTGFYNGSSVTVDINNPNNLINALGVVPTAAFDSKYQIKANGAYPLPGGLRAAASLQLLSGQPLNRLWTVTSAVTRLTQVNQPVFLVGHGNLRQEWQNLLDVRLSRGFTAGMFKFEPTFDVYNLLNTNTPVSQVQQIGPSLGRPTAVLDGRMVRVGIKLEF